MSYGSLCTPPSPMLSWSMGDVVLQGMRGIMGPNPECIWASHKRVRPLNTFRCHSFNPTWTLTCPLSISLSQSLRTTKTMSFTCTINTKKNEVCRNSPGPSRPRGALILHTALCRPLRMCNPSSESRRSFCDCYCAEAD